MISSLVDSSVDLPKDEKIRHVRFRWPLICHQRLVDFRPKCMDRLLFASDVLHASGSRSYGSGLLIDTRVVTLLGLRSHRGLISCYSTRCEDVALHYLKTDIELATRSEQCFYC